MAEQFDFPKELRCDGGMLAKSHPYTADMLNRAAIEIERMQATIDHLLTCGNHIALYRTKHWPGYVLGGLTREQQCENALRKLGATQDYDMWCCWSGMMQARDTHTSGERT